MEWSECGAAALASVLAHHGRWVSLEELRVACGVSRDGARPSALLKAARAYGFEATDLRAEPESFAELRLPAILQWELDHFVVLEGWGRKGVFVNDPSRGPRTVTWDEVDRSFSGVVLSFEPNDEFEPKGSPPSLLGGLVARMRGGAGAIMLCVLAGLGLLVPGLLVPAAVRIFVNDYLGDGNRTWFWPLALGVSLGSLVQISFTWLQYSTLSRLSLKLSMSSSARFFEHVLTLPLSFFNQRYAAQVIARVRLNDDIANVLSSSLATSALALIASAFFLILMAIYDWQLTLVTLVFAAGNLAGLRTVSRRQRDISLRLAQDQTTLTATAATAIIDIENIQASSEDGTFFARWAGQQAKVVSLSQSLGASVVTVAGLPALLLGLCSAAVVGFGGWQVMAGSLSIGTLIAFRMLMVSFLTPLGALVGFAQTVDQTAGNLAAVEDVLRHPPETVPARRSLPGVSRLSGALELVDVTFGYAPHEDPLLVGFSLRIEPGRRVALVGPSGSGKSTVGRLAAGLLQPWAGRVLLDGIPIRELPPELVASTIGYVEQDPLLFRVSVRDNLTLWDSTVDEEAMIAAARDALIHDDIVRRPGGYDRPLDQNGRDWSGGQRQRLELARALTGAPSLLILDEATSAVDAYVEHHIDRNLRARGCAALVVAHRLSTIRDCDEIVVLDQGRVAERGTHAELAALGGAYCELIAE